MFSLTEILDVPLIKIVDVGASLIDGEPPYQQLVNLNKAKIIGFEPNPAEYEKILEQKPPHLTCLPYALGDGSDGVLRICQAPGMTSLLEPDFEILEHFHGFADWATVMELQPISTHRLDDLEEVKTIDYLKLDVQGGELAVISGGKQKIEQALVIHTEVQFIPFYQEQPLFAELDQALRELGFYLHRFNPLISRVFKPLLLNNNFYEGCSQVLWSDAIYVKRFTDFSQLSSEQLRKLALVIHEVYGSIDLVSLILKHLDAQEGTNFLVDYIQLLMQTHN